MGILKKILDLLTPSDRTMVSMVTHQQLVELLLPKQYWHGNRAENIAYLAEKRLILEVPAPTRVKLFMWGLEHKDEAVRHACAEHLCAVDLPEVTDALASSLDDPSHHIRFQAALHLEYHANRFYPGQVSTILQRIATTLGSETNDHVRECLEEAFQRLERF